jgi:RNA polymerase sigma-B factor
MGEVATVSSGQRQTGAQTRERLIESHLPLVKALARRYAGPDTELDDLVQVGAVGLIKASDRFDPGKGVAFATFATPTIEGEIRHHLRDRGTAMRIPRHLQRLGRRIHQCREELAVKLGRSPTIAEVAAALQVSEDEVERALAAERARDSVPLAAEADAPRATEEPSSGSDNRLTLASSMRTLDDRERRIIYLRFHADKTERQIARQMGISQAHVSRLLSGALTKLRDGLNDGGDTTAQPVISPDSEAGTRPNQPQKHEKRQTGASGKGRRPEPVADAELRAAIERWLASERRGSEPPNGGTAETSESSEAPHPPQPPETSKGPATGTDRKPVSTHSGRFLVRMPSTLHQQLAQAAEREQVSLNRFVTDALATTVSPGLPADEGEPQAIAQPDQAPAGTQSDDAPAGTQSDHAPAGAPHPAAEPAAPPRPALAAADGGPPPARTIRMVLAANLAIVVLSVAVAAVLLVMALQRGI